MVTKVSNENLTMKDEAVQLPPWDEGKLVWMACRHILEQRQKITPKAIKDLLGVMRRKELEGWRLDRLKERGKAKENVVKEVANGH